jgi:hypothetical protein
MPKIQKKRKKLRMIKYLEDVKQSMNFSLQNSEKFVNMVKLMFNLETLSKGLFDVYYPHIKKILSKINEKT